MTRDGSIATFWALSDPIRLEILEHIAGGSHVTVTQLADALPITRQAVARHVRTLEDAGLVVGTRQGRELRYRVEQRPLDEASAWLDSRRTAWDRTLGRLAHYLESTPSEED